MTKRFGILAYPAKHSLSPLIHNEAFKMLNIDAEYGVFEVDEYGLAEFMNRVKHEPIDGLSVSLPHKETIMLYLDVVDDDAKKIGAVNTVVNRGGFLYGYNTDYLGSNMALEEVVGSLKGKNVSVLGAGGATRAIVYGLLKAGANVGIYNRSETKAHELADEFAGMFGVDVKSGSLENVVAGDILIQATSVWIKTPELKIEEFIDNEVIDKFEVIMDIIYKPRITPLLKRAEEMKKKIITGDKMFIYQALPQFKLLTEQKAPKAAMENILTKNLL